MQPSFRSVLGTRRRLFLMLAVVASATFVPAARAQFTWNLNNSGNWSTTTNWNPNGDPSAAGTTVSFGNVITASRTVTLTGGRTIGYLSFDSVSSSSSVAYTIASNTLTFNNNSAPNEIVVTGGANTAGQQTISSNIIIATSEPFMITNGGAVPATTGALPTLLISSGTAIGASTPIVADGHGFTRINPALSTNFNSLTKNGTGILQLNNANTYLGTSTISQGLLLVTNAFGSATSSGSLTIKKDANLGGTGIAGGSAGTPTAVLFETSGAQVSPGLYDTAAPAAIGNLRLGSGSNTVSVTMQSGTKYNWDVSVAGTNSASATILNTGNSSSTATQDRITITGALAFTDLSVAVTGIGATGFDNTKFYSWTIASFTAGMGTSNLDNFGNASITVAGLTGAAGSSFTLNLDNTNGRLYLNYQPTPIPEPSLVLAAGFGLFGGTWYLRRRRSA